MKNLLALVLFFSFTISNAQEIKPKFEKSGNLVKATYYFEDGSIKEQGFFKNKKLTGKWVAFNKQGDKTATAYYSAGKKVGTWFACSKNSVREVTYNNNVIVSIKNYEEVTK